MNFNAPLSSGKESKESTRAERLAKINVRMTEIKDEINEAHMTYDDGLVDKLRTEEGKLQAEIAGLEAGEVAGQESPAVEPSTKETLAEIDNAEDPVVASKLQDHLDAKFAVGETPAVAPAPETPAAESVQVEKPLDDAHVDAFTLEKNKKDIESVINEINGAKSYSELSEFQRAGLSKLHDRHVDDPELSKKFKDAIFNKAIFLVDMARKGEENALVDLSKMLNHLNSKTDSYSEASGFSRLNITSVLSEEQSARLLKYAENKFRDVTGSAYSVDAVRSYARSFN